MHIYREEGVSPAHTHRLVEELLIAMQAVLSMAEWVTVCCASVASKLLVPALFRVWRAAHASLRLLAVMSAVYCHHPKQR